jgi:malate dehydrogenase (oxaloacetate-decarboxylating)
MLRAAAEAVAGMVDATAPGAPLLPQVDDLREVSATVAAAVTAAVTERVAAEDLARVTVSEPAHQVRDAMWPPEYRPIRAG